MPIGSSTLGGTSIRPTLSDLQIGNFVIPTRAVGVQLEISLKVAPLINQPLGDQVNELPMGTRATQNGAIDDMDDFFFC